MLGLVCLVGFLALAQGQDYCSLGCGTNHTMCKYPDGILGKDCVGYVEDPLTLEDKQGILHEHNLARNYVASGVSHLPPATNMLLMVWDEELEKIAERWANQCLFRHDLCRDTKEDYSGQNIATKWSTGILKRGTWKEMIGMWFGEIKDLSSSDIDNYDFNPETGHATQLLWADTWRVGCHMVTLKQDGRTDRTLYCNYAPAGNIITSPVYNQGRPASNCPFPTQPNRAYKYLCA